MLDLTRLGSDLATLDLTPLLLAIVLGGLIGLEREIHGRPAGLRTHILVCVASTILIVVSHQLPADFVGRLGEGQALVLDPTRLAAGIVTGIGFLGAASVIRSGDIVRGITTGACIWSVAALGVVIGNGGYALAVATTALILFVLVVFDWLEGAITPNIYRRLVVSGHSGELDALAANLRTALAERRVKLQDLHGRLGADSTAYELTLFVRCRKRLETAPGLLQDLTRVDGVERVEWGLSWSAPGSARDAVAVDNGQRVARGARDFRARLLGGTDERSTA